MRYVVDVDDHGQVFVPPGEVAASLGVSGSTFRRISQDYESVFSPLPRDGNNRRLWTLEAAQRVRQAHEAVRGGRADSTRAALLALKEGRYLPTRADLPPTLDLSAELSGLRAQVQQQGEGIAQLLQALDSRDAEIADALRAIASAQRAQAEAINALQVKLNEVSAHPASTPAGAREWGLLTRLLRALLK